MEKIEKQDKCDVHLDDGPYLFKESHALVRKKYVGYSVAVETIQTWCAVCGHKIKEVCITK